MNKELQKNKKNLLYCYFFTAEGDYSIKSMQYSNGYIESNIKINEYE